MKTNTVLARYDAEGRRLTRLARKYGYEWLEKRLPRATARLQRRKPR